MLATVLSSKNVKSDGTYKKQYDLVKKERHIYCLIVLITASIFLNDLHEAITNKVIQFQFCRTIIGTDQKAYALNLSDLVYY